jgi:glucose-6-phosphate 1-dehydrogenase
MSDTSPKPAIFVIFGITGDLAQRKLLPALYQLFKADALDPHTVILGISRRDVSAEDLLRDADLCAGEENEVCDPAIVDKIRKSLRMHRMSQTDPEEYRELYELLSSIEEERGVCMNRLYYLSIPPQLFKPIVRNLGQQNLNKSCQHGQAQARLLIEKPFGYDLASARDLIAETGENFTEEQIFRIDHYLAKISVQNILAFRSANRIVEDIWNNQHISGITITAYEKIDIEGRAIFYEEIGALRDFIQSHLLQVLAITTMELPADSSSGSMRQRRLELLESVLSIAEQEAGTKALRAQYEGYRDEAGSPHSTTETFARVIVGVHSGRWQGVPITLQTGKALSERRADVRIEFKDTSVALLMHIQPAEGFVLENPDNSDSSTPVLQAAIESFTAGHPSGSDLHPDAYERVLLDAARGDRTLFTTSQEVIAAWKVVDGVIAAWKQNDDGLHFYPKGSEDVA